MNKFVNLWRSGIQANLLVEAQAGQAFVNLRVGLGSLQNAPRKQFSHRHPGPSRLRRRQRRAEARQAAAAAEQVAATEEVSSAEEESSATEEVAENVEPFPGPETLAVEADEDCIDKNVEEMIEPNCAEQANPSLQHLPVDARDEFCPDDYFNHLLNNPTPHPSTEPSPESEPLSLEDFVMFMKTAEDKRKIEREKDLVKFKEERDKDTAEFRNKLGLPPGF